MAVKQKSKQIDLELMSEHVFLTALCMGFCFGFGEEEEPYASTTAPETAVKSYLDRIAQDRMASEVLMDLVMIVLETYADLSHAKLQTLVDTQDWPAGVGTLTDETRASYEKDHDPGCRQFEMLKAANLYPHFADRVRRSVDDVMPG